ncbi:MAG TPA: hypothetical protein VHV51_08950 [Polyangiaceae bacterium]|jgi:hypothetical protein|nr:hypothetical protein [Polyangiaceae bacterium]
MSEALARARLPLLLLSLMLLIGGSRFDNLRPFEGQVLAFGVPLITVASGVSPFFNADSGLRNAVLALGALVLALASYDAYLVVFEERVAMPALWRLLGLAVAMIAAIFLEAAGAARHVRSRLSAWFGIASVFAAFFPSHAAPKNLFGSVFGSFVVALFIGGGLGLFFGESAARRVRG